MVWPILISQLLGAQFDHIAHGVGPPLLLPKTDIMLVPEWRASRACKAHNLTNHE